MVAVIIWQPNTRSHIKVYYSIFENKHILLGEEQRVESDYKYNSHIYFANHSRLSYKFYVCGT